MSMMIHTEARVKGGMPILVEASVLTADDREIECVDLFWFNTGKPITRKFDASLTADDWSTINEAVWEAYNSR
jgi:hypothetical protein